MTCSLTSKSPGNSVSPVSALSESESVNGFSRRIGRTPRTSKPKSGTMSKRRFAEFEMVKEMLISLFYGQHTQGFGMANGCREEYQKSLYVATSGYDNVDEVEHHISSIGVKVKLIVAQEISLLWEPEEWSNDSKPSHNRLQFSWLKLPKQRRFSTPSIVWRSTVWRN